MGVRRVAQAGLPRPLGHGWRAVRGLTAGVLPRPQPRMTAAAALRADAGFGLGTAAPVRAGAQVAALHPHSVAGVLP